MKFIRSLPPWPLAVGSMFSVQLGAALSVPLISRVGPAGTAWLRLTMGALIFVVLARPPLRSVRRSDVPTLVALGVTNGIVTIAFLGAIEHLPLGTAVSIEFLGPLTVAAVHSHNRRMLTWPGMALCGVMLLTEPWQGSINSTGILWAGIAGAGWATYIILTQRVGDRFDGIGALSLTTPVAAVTAAVFGVPQALGNINPGILAAAVGLAILLPVLPYSLEMLALRRMTRNAFGTFMSIEPAIGLVLGLIVLGQRPGVGQVMGIMLVVIAGAGAQIGGQRSLPDGESDDTPGLDLIA